METDISEWNRITRNRYGAVCGINCVRTQCDQIVRKFDIYEKCHQIILTMYVHMYLLSNLHSLIFRNKLLYIPTYVGRWRVGYFWTTYFVSFLKHFWSNCTNRSIHLHMYVHELGTNCVKKLHIYMKNLSLVSSKSLGKCYKVKHLT
jgi:hypothetical protein